MYSTIARYGKVYEEDKYHGAGMAGWVDEGQKEGRKKARCAEGYLVIWLSDWRSMNGDACVRACV